MILFKAILYNLWQLIIALGFLLLSIFIFTSYYFIVGYAMVMAFLGETVDTYIEFKEKENKDLKGS